MGKRFTIILLALLISALAIMVYFFHQSRKIIFTDPYKVISTDACIVIETVDLQSFMNSLTTGKGLFGELGKIKEFNTFNQKLKYITDQLNKVGFKKVLNEGRAVISFQASKNGKIQTLMSTAVPGEIRYRQIKDMLHSSGINNVIEANTGGRIVLKVPFVINNDKDTAYITIFPGLLVCSSSVKLIEEACLQINREKDIRSMPGFSKVLLASGKNVDKIFVVFPNIPGAFKSILGEQGLGLVQKIAKLAGTAEGDIYINEEGLVLSGYTESVDSTDFLFKYKLIAPKAFHTYKILPSSTVLFETLIHHETSSKSLTDSTISPKTMDLASKLKEYTGEEITRAYIDIKSNPVGENTLIIYELTNRNLAEQIFLDKLTDESSIVYFQPDNQIKTPVYKVPYSGFSRVLAPGFAPGFDDSYFAFYDNFLITGNSFVTISKLLYDNILNKTLANDLIYRDFATTLPSRAGFFFYCVPSYLTEYLQGFLNKDIITALITNRISLNKIEAIGYQMAASNNMVYNSLSIKYKETAREESNTEWETLLDTVASIKPFFFTNHITGAKEIFIQDLKNNTYLINTAGRVLWKVPLNERINGDVYMIDYFRNGKYQLLFSGKNYLHLLDRNGNYVERYPVKLRSPATNSLSLVDYDNNLNYRLFIAGEDKKIYSYDKTGNVVKGWNLFSTNGLVKSEISYFEVSGKDYLVASDETSVYFLDRTGNKRINLKEPVTKAIGSAMRLIPGSDPSIVFSSPEGEVQKIYFDGSVKKLSLKKFSFDHSFDIFDVDGDGFGEYIFIDNGILYLYDHNKSEIFTRKFNSGELGGPINFVFSPTDRKIGVFDPKNKLIYLIGNKGETMNGFPLRGASMFSIGKLSDKSGWHLIVGGTDNFLYNYKIDTEKK